MVVLIVHNQYQQAGGEDEVVVSECELLRSRGIRVLEYRQHNDRIDHMSAARAAARTFWSQETYSQIRRLVRAEGVDVVHVHNFFPLISPSVYYAARAEGAAVVQTLHNYRLLCANALFFRDGRVCEDCLGKAIPLDGVIHKCYRGSRAASAAVTGMTAAHRAAQTWSRMVDVYVALTGFGRDKFIEGGLPADRIVVKPNFLSEDPGVGPADGHYAAFVGRLSHEKGVMTLLEAWRHKPGIPLRIAGDGPLLKAASAFIRDNGLSDEVHLLGQLRREHVLHFLSNARFLIFPSICYEGFGRSMIEAMACGKPALVSDLGAMPEVVQDGLSGLFFTPGDANALAAKARLLATDPALAHRLGSGARKRFEREYTSDVNYSLLMDIYDRALSWRIRPVPAGA